MEVLVVGAAEVRAKLAGLPGRLRGSVQEVAPQAIQLEADAIRAETPRLTGTLAGSIQTSVTGSVDGVRGRAFSDERYASFVERGTQKHGAGRHMFERGSQEAQERVEGQFKAAVDVVASGF